MKHYHVSMADVGTTRQQATRRASAVTVRLVCVRKSKQKPKTKTYIFITIFTLKSSPLRWIYIGMNNCTNKSNYCMWISSKCWCVCICIFVHVSVGWNSSKAYLLCYGCRIDSLQPPWPTYNKYSYLDGTVSVNMRLTLNA